MEEVSLWYLSENVTLFSVFGLKCLELYNTYFQNISFEPKICTELSSFIAVYILKVFTDGLIIYHSQADLKNILFNKTWRKWLFYACWHIIFPVYEVIKRDQS